MSKLRFVRDETTNDVTFRLRDKDKATNITLSLQNLAMALMAGKEVVCTVTEPKVKAKVIEITTKKKKGKKK